jgi:hypothetical protein
LNLYTFAFLTSIEEILIFLTALKFSNSRTLSSVGSGKNRLFSIFVLNSSKRDAEMSKF